ncbi:DMT family transporter [Oceanibacterium hippocampi]|uniref:Putative inner membrane transporter yiJE n=1 Tax=Oceanibacterium hippocampi TaxID=745714 RepID=A0A1Y5SJT2_9PROT|nr:DMT family transporter [Oceanibacterium hippocampi]SLN39317.1 putative inner membrane transporter yiJE [Oceanibacterium hippocampi]
MRGVAGRDLALIVLLGVFWGLNWPAVKVILGEIPPFTLRAIAFTVAAPVLAALALARGERLLPNRAEAPRLILAGLLSVFGFNVLTAFGQLVTETSKAAIIAFTMPLWAALLSAAVLSERITPARMVAIPLGLGGLALLVGGDMENFLHNPAGPLIMLGAALSWAAGTVALKSRRWSLGPLALTTWIVGVSAPPALFAALLLETPWALASPSPTVLLVLLYHLALPMVICYAAWVILLGRLPASVAAIGTLLIPVVGVLSSALLLGDPLTATKLGALALVIGSVALALIDPGRSRAGAASRAVPPPRS